MVYIVVKPLVNDDKKPIPPMALAVIIFMLSIGFAIGSVVDYMDSCDDPGSTRMNGAVVFFAVYNFVVSVVFLIAPICVKRSE
jgi:hypothetical protein